MKHIAHVLTVVMFVLVSCAPAQTVVPAIPSTARASATVAPTLTPTVSPSITPSPSPTLSLPVQPLTPVPSSDTKIAIGNLKDLQEIARYYGQIEYAAKLTKDKKHLFVLDPDGVTQYDYPTMEPLLQVAVASSVSDLQISDNGNLLLIDNNWLLDLRHDKEPVLHVLSEKIHLQNLYSKDFSLSPDGKMIVAEQLRCFDSCDYQFQVVSTEDFKVLHVSAGPTRQEHPTFSPNGAYLALADMMLEPGINGFTGATVTIRNTTDFLKESTFPVRRSPFYITDLAFSEDSSLLAVAQTSQIDVYNLVTGDIEITVPNLCQGWDRQVMFAPISALRIIESSDCSSRIWTVTGTNVADLRTTDPLNLSRVSFDNNGNPATIPYPYPLTELTSYTQQYNFQFLSDNTLAFKNRGRNSMGRNSCELSFSTGSLNCQSHDLFGAETGKDILLGTDELYYSYDANSAGIDIYSTADPSKPYSSMPGKFESLELSALDPLHKLLFYWVALNNEQTRIQIKDLESGDVVTKWEGQNYLESIVFSEDKKTAAICRSIGIRSDQGQLVLFDLVQRKTIFSMDVICGSIALTSNASKLAMEHHYQSDPSTGTYSIETLLLDGSGSFARKRLDIKSSSTAAAFSPDGSILAVACGKSEICFLNPSDGTEIHKLQAHSNLTNLAFSKDGSLLAAASQWGLISVWALPPFHPEEKRVVTASKLPVCLPGDQIIDYDAAYEFQIEPGKGADAYDWQFFQNGKGIWEYSGDGKVMAGASYKIPVNSDAHTHFAPGPLEIWVQAIGNGLNTPVFISACLVRDENSVPISQPSQPTQTVAATFEPGVLYSEDFEDNAVQGWKFDGGDWTIKQETNGNHYWNAAGDIEYPSAGYDPSNYWTDYVFQARFRLTSPGDKSFNILMRDGSAGAYVVGMDEQDYIQMALSTGQGYTVLKEGSYPLEPSKWYTARVEILGSTLRLYIDDDLVMSVQDSTLKSGSIGIFTYGRNPVMVDDIKVWALTP
jgi:WD40 repeat protein